MNYLKSIFLLIIVSLFGSLLRQSIAHTNLAMLYILVVVITATRWGRGPSLVTAILSVIIFDFFFVPPHFSITVADTEYLIAFATLFIVAIVISSLTLKAKEQTATAKKHETQTLALYNLSKELVKTIEINVLLEMAISHVSKSFNTESIIFLDENTDLKIKSSSSGFIINETEKKAAIKAFSTGNPAGHSTIIIPEADAYYIPIKTIKEKLGVLGILYQDNGLSFGIEEQRLLETFANQIASAIERLKLLEEASQVKILREAEKLHTAFLNSISHDLRTPLVSITGSLSSILDNPRIDADNQKTLIETAYEESEKLNQLVSDLLDMARVEAGALQIKKRPTEIQDLIGATIKQMEKGLKNFNLSIDIPDNIPEIEVDFILIMKVLINVLDNAIKYSQEIKEISIIVRNIDNNISIKIIDSGIGIPVNDLKNVFDKFYRVKRSQNYEGTGLGLSVCKGIIDAHKGKIWAENNQNRGTTINIMLPLVTNSII